MGGANLCGFVRPPAHIVPWQVKPPYIHEALPAVFGVSPLPHRGMLLKSQRSGPPSTSTNSRTGCWAAGVSSDAA